ncbi:MAG: hypothetical protein ACYC6Y_23050 [Thermoguttaceae bacterium]
MKSRPGLSSCTCGCDSGLDRRVFLAAVGAAAGSITWAGLAAGGAETVPADRKKEGATIRCVFLYPPSEAFAGDADGWWSWPGNEFDAEGRQKQYQAALAGMEKRLGVRLVVDPRPVASPEDARRVAQELKDSTPDGLLLCMFYNNSLSHADVILQGAEELGLPTVFFIGLGVKHGPVGQYRRPGVYFIQSLDRFDAIEYGLRMINTRKLLAQSKLLSITEAAEPREGTEKFFGIQVRVIPFDRYAQEFAAIQLGSEAAELIRWFKGKAIEVRGVTDEAFENAARAHFALKKLLADEGADGLTMNCLRRGMLKPCMSFATLNGQLVPAACENDFGAVYTQLIGQLLTGRPGFQANPCYDTETNHYYASHCTCTTRLRGPEGPEEKYLLRRFAHTNEGSCAIQVFWPEGEPVTIVKYYSDETPRLDVYAGRVVKSHPMPPAAGCTTNVEIEITDRPDACMVSGHHNLVFCGDFARKFRLFANLMRIELGQAAPVA